MAVDDLFTGGEAPLVPDPLPRLRRFNLIAATCVMLGPFCCTGPWGAFLAIWVWARAGDAVTQAESGVLPEGSFDEARKIRQRAFALMSLSISSLCIQSTCFGFGTYQSAAEWLLARVIELYTAVSGP